MKSNRDIFREEINRITRLVNQAKKQGYNIPEDLIPITPRRITQQAIENVKSIKSKDIFRPEFKPSTKAPKGSTLTTENKATVARKPAKVEPPKPKKPSTATIKPRKARMVKSEEQKITAKKPKQPKVKIEKPKKKPVEAEQKQEPITKPVEPKKPETKQVKEAKEFPTISIIDNIKHAIQEMQRSDIPIAARKNAVLHIFENTIERYTAEDALPELEKYLIEHENEIASEISDISDLPYVWQVTKGFANLARLLNVEALGAEEAESVSQMAELGDYDWYSDLEPD